MCFYSFFSSWHWFIIHRILVTKYAWFDFNFLKFAMAPFVAQYVIYPGDSSICIWKECALCYFQMKCSVNINKVHWSNKLFKTCVSSLIFLSGMICPLMKATCWSPSLLLCYCWFILLWLLIFALYIECSYAVCVNIYKCEWFPTFIICLLLLISCPLVISLSKCVPFSA